MKKILPVVVFLLVFSIKAKSQEYSFKETFDVKSPAQLAIFTSDGNINVQASEQKEIEVRFIAKKKGTLLEINKEELSEYYTLEITQSENSLEIVAKPKYRNAPFAWEQQVVLSFDIMVPAQTACNLRASDGNILIKDIEGKQICRTSDGNITLSNIKGDTEAKASDGNIRITECKGNSEAIASDGNIKLSDIDGGLYARTSDGNIELINVNGAVTGITSDGHIECEIKNVDHPVDLRTSDGGIILTVPAGAGFDLEMRGENLHADFKDFTGDISKNHISGRFNGGGELVKLATSDGKIKLNFE